MQFTTRRSRNGGFTLIELMIVVAIIAIIASVAIPKLMSARLSANEAAAISTLRSIASAEAQFQSQSAVDTDRDGSGEFGYFAEMAGTIAMRISNGAVPFAPVAGASPDDILNPTVLSAAFGNVDANGVITRSGYCFQVFLPSATAGGVTPGTGEAAGGGANMTEDPNNAEVTWCAYAWPINGQQTGNRAFFINQEGDLMQCQNRSPAGPVWETAAAGPAFDDAYTIAGDMGSAFANGVASLGPAGQIWVPVD